MFQGTANPIVYFDWPNATTAINGITFNSGPINYTFNGSNSTDLIIGDINNNVANSVHTFNIDVQFKNNANVRTNGVIIFDGAVNANGTGKVNFDGAGKVVFDDNAVVGGNVELTLMNGVDLDLGGTSQSFAKLNITGNSIIDFADGGSINIDSLNILDGGSLTIINWTIENYFDVMNQPSNAVVGRVIFDGYDGASWNGFNGHVTPMPEPATFFSVAGLFAFLGFRRKVRH